MTIEPALLEEWMRTRYFAAAVDIGSSGVQDFSLGEVRRLVGLDSQEMDEVMLRDSTSYGGLALRAAIADRYGDGDLSRVMVTHGSSEAIYLVMSTLVDPGDEAVVVHPGYHSLSSVATSLGCRPRSWELRPEDRFQPNLDDLERMLSPRTRAIVVNFPNNPTGATLTRGDQERLIALAAASGAYLVWDAALAELHYDGPSRLPDASVLYERAISIGTFSKAFGLPGLRFGWCLAPPPVLERCVHLRDRMTLHLSPLIELIAERVVRHAERLLNVRMAQARANRELVTVWAAANADVVEWHPPAGGVTGFPRLPGLSDTYDVCVELAEQDLVLLVPGRCFDDPTRVRLGFGGPTPELCRGLYRLERRLRGRAV